MSKLNFAIRNTGGALTGNIGWLFTMYFLHCDQLLRCYPSNELLMKETGIKSGATLRKHRDKLIEMKAIIFVPYKKRIASKEQKLHIRKYVYQITGIMQLPGGSIIPTVYINSPEVLESHVSLLDDLGFDTSLITQTYSKGSKTELLNSGKNDTSKNDPKVVQGTASGTEELSAPESAQGQPLKSKKKKAPMQKERNRIFDGIALLCFGFKETTKLSKQTSARIGKIVKYLNGLDIDVTPEILWSWSKHYDSENDSATRPRDVEKFATHFELFLQAPKITQQLTAIPKFEVSPDESEAAMDVFSKNKLGATS